MKKIVIILAMMVPMMAVGQIGIWEFEYAPDSNYVIVSKPGGEWDTIRIDSLVGLLNISVNDADADPTNELDSVYINGQWLLNGDSITIIVDDADNNPGNELQTISSNGAPGNLTISNGNTITLNVGDISSVNELQSLGTSGDPGMIAISNPPPGNGGVVIINVDDADADPTNELQDTSNINGLLQFVQNYGGDGIGTDTSGTYHISIDQDLSDTNELDTFTINGQQLTNGGSITITDNVYDGDTTYWRPIGTDKVQSKREMVGINANPTVPLGVLPRPGAVAGDYVSYIGDLANGLGVRKPTVSNKYAAEFEGVWKWWDGSYASNFIDQSGSEGTTGQVWGKKGDGRMGWINDAVGDVNTDNQTLSFVSPNLSITGGNSVDLSSLQDGNGYWSLTGANIFRNSKVAIGTPNISTYADLVVDNGIITTNSSSIYLGRNSGISATGALNTAVGADVLKSSTGAANTGLGASAGEFMTSQHTNTLIGYRSGRYNGGNQNTYIASHAGHSAIGSQNTAIGISALYNDTGGENVAIGNLSLQSLTGSANKRNVAIGAGAGVNAQGNENLYIGYYSAANANGGIRNVGLGSTALYNSGGDNNVGVGVATLYSNITGNNNVAVGREAGRNATGSGNVFLGYNSGYNETGSNRLYINNNTSSNPLIYGEFDNLLARINGSLEVVNKTGTATSLAGWDGNKVVSLGLGSGLSLSGGTLTASATGITALNVVDNGNSLVTIDDQNGVDQYRIGTDNINITVEEGNPDDIQFFYQQQEAELYKDVVVFSNSGYADFNTEINTTNSYLQGNATTDEITTSLNLTNVRITATGDIHYVGNGCGGYPKFVLELHVNGAIRRVREISINGENANIPFHLTYRESLFSTTEDVQLYLKKTGTCTVYLNDVSLIATRN